MNARFLLESIEIVCPLSGMGASFAGHHSLTLHEGFVAVTVWAYGKQHIYTLGDAEEAQCNTREGSMAVAKALLELIVNRDKEGA